MNDLERRQRRLDRAWIAIRVELLVALAIPVVAGFLFIASPGCLCGMFSEPPLLVWAIPWVGVATYVVGLAWMFRLSRPRVEAGERDWRYRDL
jgi:hypothetical protein